MTGYTLRIRRKHAVGDQEDGAILITILGVMIFLTIMLMGLAVLANSNVSRARSRVLLLQAQYAAESGADAAIATLNGGNTSYTGSATETTVLSEAQYKATYTTAVITGSSDKERIITSVGRVYAPTSATTPTYTRTIRVTADRTSSTTASGLMSRNIIDVDSSVKNIYTKEMFVNGYINLRSNTTSLQAEKITVAGKDTGVNNCSIEGAGGLVKPSTLGSGQAVIDVAYNNCITPPGNTSNSDFAVTANDSSIKPLLSTYIPWNYYMDSTYQDSPTGCNDWIGSGTLTIPSVGNTKKTQYPDSGSGVAASCGSNGSLALGSNTYNITDNVHIRANLCAASACNPTFNNTSGSIKYIFIEGDINFASLHTASGSAPIVFITYGADPGTHNKCPLGDSIYLNKNGSTGTNAPAAYLLASNGICLYQTKFDASPALGGLGGKNIYISSNSGNPFDLYLDPNFPVASIPIDLAWRATSYERL